MEKNVYDFGTPNFSNNFVVTCTTYVYVTFESQTGKCSSLRSTRQDICFGEDKNHVLLLGDKVNCKRNCFFIINLAGKVLKAMHHDMKYSKMHNAKLLTFSKFEFKISSNLHRHPLE